MNTRKEAMGADDFEEGEGDRAETDWRRHSRQGIARKDWQCQCVVGTRGRKQRVQTRRQMREPNRLREWKPQYLVKTILLTALKGAIKRYPTRIIMLEVIHIGRARSGYWYFLTLPIRNGRIVFLNDSFPWGRRRREGGVLTVMVVASWRDCGCGPA